jgi:hypothetical protein
MIHDTLRALLIIAVLAAGCSLLVETRQRLAMLEIATRIASQQPYAQPAYQPMPQPHPQPGRIQQLGRATLELADAALGIVR